jgi:hypothetical protein
MNLNTISLPCLVGKANKDKEIEHAITDKKNEEVEHANSTLDSL